MLRPLKSLLRESLPQPLREFVEDVRYLGLPMPFRAVRPHSLLSNLNLFFLQELALRCDRLCVPGDFVECGVYRGRSAGVLGYAAIRSPFDRRLWLYDAFMGMPVASVHDDDYSRSIQGKYVGSEVQTRRILWRLGIPENRFKIVAGWFEDTLPKSESFPVALLHIDCDFYNPVKLTLETFYDWLEPLGYVVLNDYGSFQGCRKATNEFLDNLEANIPLIQIDQAAYFFQKPSSIVGSDLIG
jgi:O-methyltransferase